MALQAENELPDEAAVSDDKLIAELEKLLEEQNQENLQDVNAEPVELRLSGAGSFGCCLTCFSLLGAFKRCHNYCRLAQDTRPAVSCAC